MVIRDRELRGLPLLDGQSYWAPDPIVLHPSRKCLSFLASSYDTQSPNQLPLADEIADEPRILSKWASTVGAPAATSAILLENAKASVSDHPGQVMAISQMV